VVESEKLRNGVWKNPAPNLSSMLIILPTCRERLALKEKRAGIR